MANNLKQLNQLLRVLDNKAMTDEDFLNQWEKVVTTLKKWEAKYENTMKEYGKIIERLGDKLESENKSSVSKTLEKELSDFKSKFAKLEKEHRDGMNFIYDRVRDLKDGKDADEERVINEVISRIEIPEIPEQESAVSIADRLSGILEIRDIKELEERLEELKKIRTRGGGGVSDMRIRQAFKLILKTEAPSGDIDGANTTYTVTQPIFAVLAFSINGEVIAELPNYTVAGNTIEFSSALPAAYSGKDFEVKYI